MHKKKSIIYLDYAATTPVDPKVLKAMLPFFKEFFGNPSSAHFLGQKAKEAIENARTQVAQFLNCLPQEIIFTSSATEANNLAILGTIKAAQKRGIKKPHIITTQIEHKAILEPLKQLERTQEIEISYLKVTNEGIIDINDLKNLIKKNTVLVSVMYANNEIGTIQPIEEIGNFLKNLSGISFHTDAVQAVNYLDCNVETLGVNLLTISAHKIYGPKGIGALYVRRGCPLEPLIFGGSQEYRKRAGTENVPGIVGLGAAIKEVQNRKSEIKNLKNLRDELIRGVLKNIPGSQLNGSWEKRLPNNANFTFEGVDGEALVMALDKEGIAASTGSACSSQNLEPSHVLLALGKSKKEAQSSLRLTLGRTTTKQDIEKTLKILVKTVNTLKRHSIT